MNRMSGTFLVIIACAILAVVVFFLYDLSSEKTFATPAEAFEASRDAVKKNDMRAFCQCLTRESRDLLGATVIVSEFMKRQSLEKAGKAEQMAQVKVVEKIFAQHGLTDEFLSKMVQQEGDTITHPQAPVEEKVQAAQALLAPVKDVNGLIADFFQATMKDGENDFSVLKDAKLTNVKILGKEAVGGLSFPDQDQPSPMNFRKQGEGWRIVLPLEQKQRPMMPPGMPPGLPPGHPR